MRPLVRPLLLLLALVGAAAAAEAPSAGPLPDVTRAVREDPPLPGEPLDGWPGLAEPAPTGPLLTVEAAVELALRRSPALAAVRQEVEAARSDRVVAGRLRNPRVGIEVVPDAAATDVDLEVGLDLSDAVLAVLRRDVAAATLDAERLRAAVAGVRLELDVRAAFFDLQAAEQQLRVGQRALDGFAAARDLARALRASGGVPAVDAVAQEAAYERARLAVVELEQATAAARERLRARLGVADVALDVAPALPIVPGTAPDAAGLEGHAVAASLELAELRARVDALDRATTLAGVQGWLPEVEASVLASSPRSGATLVDAPPWSLGAGLELTVPLFAQGVAARRALDRRAAAAADRVDAVAVDVRAEARTLATRLAAAHARAVHLRDVVLPVQRETLRQTLLQFDAMQVGVFDLLQAQRAAFEVELALVDATRAYWVADAAADALRAGVRPDLSSSPEAPSFGGAPPSGGH